MLQLKSQNYALKTDTQIDAISQNFSTEFAYQVHFTEGAFAPGNLILKQALIAHSGKVVSFICFIDSEVFKAHPQLVDQIQQYADQHSGIRLLAKPVLIEGGEICKKDATVLNDLYATLLKYSVDRHNCIIAIGGGAVLDLVGYAASTAHRGIRLIRMPTTVLSQNDSGVGVKNGVNFLGRKNYLGTFCPPDAVICDFLFLKSLSQRDKRSGMAEAIKVSLIRDGDFFNWLEKNSKALAEFEQDAVAYSIKCSAAIHARQISNGGDPFEKGSNRPLDYGHWLAHKLEVMSDYKIKHGEAVAIGMMVDARYSYAKGLLSADSLSRIQMLIDSLGFKLWNSSMEHKDEQGGLTILQGLEEFREHLGGELSITLLKDIGVAEEVHKIDMDIMRKCLAWVKQLHVSTSIQD